MPGDDPARSTGQGCGPQAIGLVFLLGGAALAFYTLGPVRDSFTRDDYVFRLAMSFVIAGIGAALLLLGSPDERRVRRVQSTATPNPTEPWLRRDDWAAGYARSESKSQARVRGLAGLLCLLISVPVILQLPSEVVKRSNWPALLALIFPLVGLFLTGQGVMLYLRHRKFQDLRFELTQVPGTIGGPLTGRITGGFLFPGGTDVELTLSCVHSYASQSDSDRTRWQRVLWQEKKIVPTLTGGLGSHIPVEFTIPCDVRETDNHDPDNEICWRLSAYSDIPGVDFRSTFEAPVFRTPATDVSLTVARLDAERQERLSGQKPADAKITGSPSQAGGMQFYLPPARTKGVAAALTLFGLLSVGSGLFFGYAMKRGFGWIGAVIPITVIGGLGVLLLLLSASVWFTATRIELLNHDLRMRTSWLGISHLRVIHAPDIARLELRSNMQRGDQIWYDLILHLANGRRVTAGRGLARNEGDWLVAEIKRELDLR